MMDKTSSSGTEEDKLSPCDFPTGRLGVPSTHPNIVRLKELVLQAAAEHQLADKMGPRTYYGQVLQSRLEIVTDIVSQVRPNTALGGKFKKRLKKDGPWIVDTGYSLMDLRSRVSSALCKHPFAKLAARKADLLLEAQLSHIDPSENAPRQVSDDYSIGPGSKSEEKIAQASGGAITNCSLDILSWVASKVSSSTSKVTSKATSKATSEPSSKTTVGPTVGPSIVASESPQTK
jgi:hypothetical protein